MKKLLFLIILFLSTLTFAQENATYQKPSQEILELAEAPLAPSIRMDSKGENIIFLYRSNFKSIDELSEKEMRLGGLRINPKTNINSRQSYFTNVKVRLGRNGKETAVSSLPENGWHGMPPGPPRRALARRRCDRPADRYLPSSWSIGAVLRLIAQERERAKRCPLVIGRPPSISYSTPSQSNASCMQLNLIAFAVTKLRQGITMGMLRRSIKTGIQTF